MSDVLNDCDMDLVIKMDEAGVGVEEVLQFAKGCLTRDEIRSLIFGLEKQIAAPVSAEQEEVSASR